MADRGSSLTEHNREISVRYKTIRDVVEFSQQLHTKLAHQYAELEQLATSERARLMLDYLQRHERHLTETLAQYEADAAKGIMETWMQYVPECHVNELLEKVRDVSLNDVDDIVATALEVDDCLIKIYEDMAGNNDLDELKVVAQNLMQLESNEMHQVARSALRLNDL